MEIDDFIYPQKTMCLSVSISRFETTVCKSSVISVLNDT